MRCATEYSTVGACSKVVVTGRPDSAETVIEKGRSATPNVVIIAQRRGRRGPDR